VKVPTLSDLWLASLLVGSVSFQAQPQKKAFRVNDVPVFIGPYGSEFH
jgi:hypothetical protein